MFGYLRFLKINKFYLKQEKNIINDIEGVKIENISKKTIEICLDILIEINPPNFNQNKAIP